LVIAIIGNAAEHSTAVMMALKNKMDLAFNIAFESSKQIALFVAPVLVLASLFFSKRSPSSSGHMEVVGNGGGHWSGDVDRPRTANRTGSRA